MGKMMSTIALLICVSAGATTVEVANLEARRLYDSVNSVYKWDRSTLEVFVSVQGGETTSTMSCDELACIPDFHTFYSEIARVRVDSLKLVDNDIYFMTEDERVHCGRIRLSRWLRVPTLYLTGACQLKTKRKNGSIKVDLIVN